MNAYFLFFLVSERKRKQKKECVLFGEICSFRKEPKGLQCSALQYRQQPQPLLVLKKGLRTTPQTPRQSLARGLTAPPVALTLR